MRRLRDRRGSALVEMLISFPVFFAFVSSIAQLVFLEVAGLATDHAAITAARAAVVVAADDPRYYGSGTGSLAGKRGEEVDEAIANTLRIATEKPVFHATFSGFGEGTIVKAELEFDYPCAIPVGGSLVCGLSKTRHIKREARMPSQTAGYTYP